MYGWEGEGETRKQHMLPGPAVVSAPVANSPPIDSFFKEGRQISVGDCALFRAGESPPFIGIIGWLSSDKGDNCLKLGVNWLYRPADVKLSKGVLLETAPNEIFYSFHKDEIPASSLLHPCKVAFLRKDVELPSSISSFVCRRVYDIANKCLWWLTDKDYINEHQEEVDHLLDKTRLEMHAAVHSEGRSPKSLNSPSSTTQQLKLSSDNSVQNSSTSFTQSKGRKRERGDPSSELSKRERATKIDHEESSISTPESSVKLDIAKITDKEGGLTSFEGVEKLVHRMQLDKMEKKVGLTDRLMFADVIATTDRYECLGWFVQLGGVPVLNDWLQEAHKGKSGDGTSPKESDKCVDELLLALLRALDKLPVNLNALQSCHVGRSVNHLRSHKNIDIQKKARGLVDTWKKRVEAEMKMNDAKSGPCQQVSWSGKPVLSEASHGGNRRLVSSSDTGVKSSVTSSPSASKVVSVKLGQADPVVKSASASLESVQCSSLLPPSITVGSRGGADTPVTPIKEEKSSSSNNNHSCASDHARTVGSAGKEDMRSSTAGSVDNNKSSTASSRCRKLINGSVGSNVTGAQKDTHNAKSATCNKNAPQDKSTPSGLSCEKAIDVPVADNGNGHRVIVRLPNPGRNPVQTPSGGFSEEPFVLGSGISSPSLSEKQQQHALNVRGKTDACRSSDAVNVENEARQSSEVNEEGDKSPVALPNDEESRITEESSEIMDEVRATSSENEKGVNLVELKSGRRFESNYSSMNALIESCVKCSEADDAILPEGDDMGMNLLASVATGEMSRSELNSPTGSPQMNSLPLEESATANDNVHDENSNHKNSNGADNNSNDAELKLFHVGAMTKAEDMIDACTKIVSQEESELLLSGLRAVADYSISAESKNDHPSPGHKPHHLEQNEEVVASNVVSLSDNKTGETSDHALKSSQTDLAFEKPSFAGVKKDDSKGEGTLQMRVENEICISGENNGSFTDLGGKRKFTSSLQNKMADQIQVEIEDNTIKTLQSNLVSRPACDECDVDESDKKAGVKSAVNLKVCAPLKEDSIDMNPRHEGSIKLESQLPDARNYVDASAKCANAQARSGAEKDESEIILEKKNTSKRMRSFEPADAQKKPEKTIGGFAAFDNIQEKKNKGGRKSAEVLVDNKEESSPQVLSRKPLESSKSNPQAEGKKEGDLKPEVSEAVSGTNAKLTFDLNEGFTLEDGNHQGDLTGTAKPPSATNLSSSLGLSSSLMSVNLQHASITVAAPAKGPFVPPEDLLRSKGELGWKGSAATSAFRRAESRKALDIPLAAAEVSNSDAGLEKPGRLLLDIDLNVPDERVLEDMGFKSSVPAGGSQLGPDTKLASHRFSGGLDLDLNRVDECVEQKSAGTSGRLDIPPVTGRPPSSSGFRHGEANVARTFDLNNGPGPEDVSGVEAVSRSQHQFKNNMPSLSSIPGVKNNQELGCLNSWFPPGNPYSAVPIQSFLPDGGEQHPYSIVSTAGTHQRILASAAGGSFGGELYRGPLLSSSMPFAAVSAPFPYGGFPFGSSYPLPSTSFSGGSPTLVDSSSGGGSSFPSVPSQLLGPVGAVTSAYPRPYMVSLPDGGTGAENSRKWSQHGLDLNTGPGNPDLEGRDERLPLSSLRQLSVSSSQPLAEEQAKIYQKAKRKEPEGGWDVERFIFKQPSWQ